MDVKDKAAFRDEISKRMKKKLSTRKRFNKRVYL
jgi:hypothetical protein